MARAAAPKEITQSSGVKPGPTKPKDPKGDVVALLNLCVQELDQLNALLDRLALIASRDRKEEREMLTRVLGKLAGGSTASLWRELGALSEAMKTHNERVAGGRAETTIAMIELRARIRHHFHRAFEFLAELDPDVDSEEDIPPQRRCCLKIW